MRIVGRRLAAVLAVLASVVALGSAAPPAHAAGTDVGPADWPTYGHDQHRTFHGETTLTEQSVGSLQRAWFFPTGDSVTAPVTVVGGTVYVGSWDGHFYALNAHDGTRRWAFTLDSQPAVSPQPGHRQPTDITSDGGMVTAAATFVPAAGRRPDLVVFGGGYTLYAVRASDGALFWKHAYTGRPEYPPDPRHDDTRFFSSPAVVGDRVLVSADADGGTGCQDSQGHRVGCRGYLVSADLNTGDPQWIRELDVDQAGRVLNDGCGNVWASPTVVEQLGIEVVGVSDCNFLATAPYHERILAVRIADGTLLWVFTPPRIQDARGGPDCDWDFGATANAGTAADGTPAFLGVGGKDGTYYALDPATGALRWQRTVAFGGFSGGFIGSTAYDGVRVYGATAFGDFGRFEAAATAAGSKRCEPTNPADEYWQQPSMHALDATTGKVAWQEDLSNSFGPTTVAGGMVFVCPDFNALVPPRVDVRNAASGRLLATVLLPADCDSGAVPWGNALIVGTSALLGSPTNSPTGSLDGVWAFTPGGVAPSAPQGGVAAGEGGAGGAPPVSRAGGVQLSAMPGESALPNTGSSVTPGWAAGPAATVVLASLAGRRRRRR
jgi:polyvinyl alcohol dehydrogenase (cytochrome)